MFIQYSSTKKDEWNSFITKSKNGIFLFYRDYMEYHSNRFLDHSLMFYDNNKLLAVLPANRDNNTLISHGGLTFGGFVTDTQMKVTTMLGLFQELTNYLKACSIVKLVYKCIPHIYHTIPAEEDRYALFRMGAKLYRRDVTTTIALDNAPKFQELRVRSIKKASKEGIQVKQTDDFASYWAILNHNLKIKYDTKPVHTIDEIQYLHNQFPENIKLYGAYRENILLAGVLIYESTNIAHAQYIANSDEGRDTGALDLIFSSLINEYSKNKRYFDFGISNEKEGLYLNEGLINFKEGFGARAVVHDFYEVSM